MQKKYLINRKPAYRHGQLLLEDDFIDEQQFRRTASTKASYVPAIGVPPR